MRHILFFVLIAGFSFGAMQAAFTFGVSEDIIKFGVIGLVTLGLGAFLLPFVGSKTLQISKN